MNMSLLDFDSAKAYTGEFHISVRNNFNVCRLHFLGAAAIHWCKIIMALGEIIYIYIYMVCCVSALYFDIKYSGTFFYNVSFSLPPPNR